MGKLHNTLVADALGSLYVAFRAGHVCELIRQRMSPPPTTDGAWKGRGKSERPREVASFDEFARGAVCFSASGVEARQASSALARTESGDIVFISPTASQMIFAINDAVGVATSSFELANVLDPITQSAASHLPAEEADIVQAVASVALSSLEYWEQNAQAALNTLGPQILAECNGMTTDQCLGDTHTYELRWDSQRLLSPVWRTVPTMSAADRCSTALWPFIRRAAIADIAGGVAGAVRGFFTVGPAGAGVGAAGGLAGASVGSMVKDAIEYTFCINSELGET